MEAGSRDGAEEEKDGIEVRFKKWKTIKYPKSRRRKR
jgi:hypothetical protein